MKIDDTKKFMLKSYFKNLLIIILSFMTYGVAIAQNVGLSSSTTNAGNVKVGQTTLVEIWINNKSSDFGPILPFRLKPQISYSENLQLADSGHQLPDGWKMLSDKGGAIQLTNGSDTIPPLQRRIIKLAFIGKKVSGRETIVTNLFFSNGKPPGDNSGPSLPRDRQDDNSTGIILRVIQ